ncbi:50S ribosome-binding GTPase [Halobacteriovorax sp. GB3]|uniref:tRNA modification GTPase n=1 Tax=Halobacteriovorax sp. GB3 TaxID=2719615 RepID=UPI00235DEBCA|nr:GTPase [Halobacteriovorax sp. GB3]MDD0854733.1 50S ribosome-binding GTPase [Halobacteriovorax sp. GB3]
MLNLYDDKPIIACSTGTKSNTAIGLIRLSGFKDILDLQEFFSLDLNKVKTRFAHYTDIISSKGVVDSVVLTFYKGPNSYNGENILELGVHGNQFNIRRILKLFVDSGKFRAAKEGEFTYRALLNQKLTLSQVEGLDMLLNASSGLMLQQGLETLQGNLHKEYTDLYDSFIKLKGAVEITIDFSEDVGEQESIDLLNRNFSRFFSIIKRLNNRIQGEFGGLTSPEIVLVGQTNAGKSSLFNSLLQDNRSIVSSTAGTTRDYVSEYVFIDEVNYKLIDTAGIRETVDQIEKIGIERTFEVLERAFYKILVVNPGESNFEDFKKLPQDLVFDLLIISHKDLVEVDYKGLFSHLPKFKKCFHMSLKNGPIEPVEVFGPIEPDVKNGPIEPEFNTAPIEPISKSGPMGPVHSFIFIEDQISFKFSELTANNPILLERHRDCVNSIYCKAVEFDDVLRNINDIAIISSELNILGKYVSELIGIVRPDDVLNDIFSNFCIGK